MTDHQTETFFDLIQNIAASLAHLVAIQKARYKLEQNNMLTVSALTDLFALVTALIKAKSTDDATIATLNAQIATTTANDAALNDPAFLAQLDELKAAATAATVDPNAVIPPAGNPEGVAYNPALTYIAGDTALDTSGQLWTAVTPVSGEQAPTAPNWTLVTPAPA